LLKSQKGILPSIRPRGKVLLLLVEHPHRIVRCVVRSSSLGVGRFTGPQVVECSSSNCPCRYPSHRHGVFLLLSLDYVSEGCLFKNPRLGFPMYVVDADTTGVVLEREQDRLAVGE
jgi:hypothetical protein